jgi:hypothetical protein
MILKQILKQACLPAGRFRMTYSEMAFRPVFAAGF